MRGDPAGARVLGAEIFTRRMRQGGLEIRHRLLDVVGGTLGIVGALAEREPSWPVN